MTYRLPCTVDVVVVGSGLAGCAAALAGAAHGLETVLLEKSELLGGKTAWSNGGLWIPCNDLARDAGIADSLDEARAYLTFLGGGFAVDEHRDAYVDGAAGALRTFTEFGLRFGLVRNVSDIYYGLAPGTKAEGRMVEIALFPARDLGPWREKVRGAQYQQRRSTFDEAVRWGGRGSFGAWDPALQAEREALDVRGLGAGLVAAFAHALLARGVPLRLGTAVERLTVAEGRVDGVVAGGEKIRARRGVVLAAGNYENNAALVRNYEELPMRGQFPGGLNGDALVMAAEVGATVRTIPRVLDIFLGYDVPGCDGKPAAFRSAGTHELPLPHAIVVNGAGRRFGDEAFFQRLLNGLRDFDVATHRFRNLPCYFVFSQLYVEKYGFGGEPPGSVPAYVARGDRPDALAAQLGIDPHGLAAEIERFNAFVAAGADPDFDRGGLAWSRSYGGDGRNRNPNLGALEPPFYGVRLHPTGGTSAGLLTTVDAQVLGVRDAPIPGLYASGDCSAHVDMGCGQQAGISLGRALVFGLAAVKHMLHDRSIARTA